LLLAVTTCLMVRNDPSQQAGSRSHTPPSRNDIFSGLRTVFGSSRFWRLAPLSFASYGATISVLGLWGSPYLIHIYGLSKTTASAILMAIPIGTICGAPLWGRLSDKLRRRKFLILLGQGVMLLVFSSLSLDLNLPRWGLLLQFWLLGFTGTASSLLYVQVKETFPLSIAGTAMTALNFFLMLGAAVFQHMMGLIIGNWHPSITGALPVAAYQWGFAVSAALLALALINYSRSQDTGPGASPF